MEYSSIQSNDLPDEVLIIILKKLYNADVLYSLLGVNKRLNTIVRDSIFTSCLSLMIHANGSLYRFTNPIVDRFCREILPEIRDKIKWLDLESYSIVRILLATNYPNLRGLGLNYLHIKTARSLFINDEALLTRINKNQISSLVIDITEYDKEDIMSEERFIPLIFTRILTMFTNLQYLNFGPSLIRFQQLSLYSPLPIVNSSSLLELHICLDHFSDCLHLLDGRFKNLRILCVNISLFDMSYERIINEDKLPNLRCFSLHCKATIDAYDEFLVPLVQRMFNFEQLNLNLSVFTKKTFIDGNNLKTNIVNHMQQLKKFTFNISSDLSISDQIGLPSHEDIQHTFEDFLNNQIISCVDYFQGRQSGRCHIYSYPYQSKSYNYITNNFPGGLSKSVREILLFDEHAFEHEFFLRIAQSFPFVKKITIRNSKPQKSNLGRESTEDKQDLTIAEYPHLTYLFLYHAHDDYLEQFLLDTKTCLPNTVNLTVNYQPLKRVTHYFKRIVTQINCAKLKSLFLNGSQYPRHIKNYFPHADIE